MPELIQTFKAMQKTEDEKRRFLASLQGVNLNEEEQTEGPTFDDIRRKALGINATPTLTAAANNDVLVGLDINPTFTNGAFTGVTNLAIRTLSGRLSFTGAAGNGTLNLFTTNSTFLSNASNGVLTFNRNSSSGWQGIEHQVSGALMAYDAITTSGEFRRFANSGGYFQTFYSNGVEAIRLSTSQNLLIGTTTDAGFRLDVNGTARAKSFKARHAKNIAKGKMSAAYWANKVKW